MIASFFPGCSDTDMAVVKIAKVRGEGLETLVVTFADGQDRPYAEIRMSHDEAETLGEDLYHTSLELRP